jgi:hypothetical protein
MLQRERKEHERDWSRRKRTYDELLRDSVGIEEAIEHIVELEGPAMSHQVRSRRKRSRARQHDGRTPSGSPV